MFSPTGINGLFIWYNGDSIGTANNNIVTYWKDDSGSGNHLQYSGSSGVNYPTYISGLSIFNYHNAVSFSGLSNSLSSTSNNNSLNLPPSSVTLFSVFYTRDPNLSQTICAVDNVSNGGTAFGLTINSLNHSGFEFGYGKNQVRKSGWLQTASYDSRSGYVMYSPNQLVIRCDSFNVGSGILSFADFGSTVGTGVATTISNTSNVVILGSDYTYPYEFNGCIAEVIGYNNNLSSTDISSVNQYLVNKYSPGITPPFSGSGPIATITGCFLWFKADSIGNLPSGNPVNYWADLSNSGNSVTVVGNNSGQTPVYLPNSINGYPSVGFYGTDGLTVSNNNSLNINNNNLTLFTVFSTSGLGQQVVCSLDSSTQESKVGFISALNSSNDLILETSADQIISSSGLSQNEFIIRTDRFDDHNNLFIDYFNKSVASGNTSITPSVPPSFNIGYATYTSYAGSNLHGKIAEIVGYNQVLSSGDKQQVYNYLYNKYFQTPPQPPIFTVPPDISGLYLWLRSTSIGITGVDGSPVQYWPDDSGSGNNLSALMNQSGTWIFPTFHRNVINNYPTVRFINGGYFSYLISDIITNNFDFEPNDLTAFTVFKSNEPNIEQCIYTVDDGANQTFFSIGLNKTYNNSFNVMFGGYNPTYAIASSTTFGTAMYGDNFMIRADRVRASDGVLIFDRYGADVATGVIDMPYLNNKVFCMGYSQLIGASFYGDIAEVILYGRRLLEYEYEEVSNYLLQKYMPGNVMAAPCFVYSTANSSIYNDQPLYTAGQNNSISTNTTLYTASSTVALSGLSLYSLSIQPTGNNVILFTQSSYQQFPPINLFLNSNTDCSGSLNLYTLSTIFGSNNTSLSISGSSSVISSIIPLYTMHDSSAESGLNMYIDGIHNQYSGINLFTQASQQQFPPLNLYTVSVGNSGNVLNPNYISLYINGLSFPEITGKIPLFLNSTPQNTYGLYGVSPLYVEAGKTFQDMPLYVGVIPEDTNPSAILPLFVGTPIITGVNKAFVPMYVSNLVSGYSAPVKRFFIRGGGELNDGFIYNSDLLPLFLQQSGVTPMINNCYANTPLYIGSDIVQSGVNTLFIYNSLSMSSGTLLYQKGLIDISGGMNMYSAGRNLGFDNSIIVYTRGY